MANPNAGLLFVIPGRDETLRVEGVACLTTDPEILALWDDELRRPKVAIGIRVRTVYIHCAKSFRRGRVWDPQSWAELAGAPDICDVIIEQVGMDASSEVVRTRSKGYAFDLESGAARPRHHRRVSATHGYTLGDPNPRSAWTRRSSSSF